MKNELRISNFRELVVVTRALRLHRLLNELGNQCISADNLDDASVAHMERVALDVLREEVARREFLQSGDEDFVPDEEAIEWYLGNVDYAAMEYAVYERAHWLPDDVHEDIGELVQRGLSRGYWRQDVEKLATRAVKADKEWIRSEEGQEWLNNE